MDNNRWLEDTLIKSGAFALPGKKALTREAPEIKVILVDATETPGERPQKKQRRHYSGKKKRKFSGPGGDGTFAGRYCHSRIGRHRDNGRRGCDEATF